MPCSPNSQFNSSVSGPPSSLKHVPPPSPWASFRSGAHLCASAPIFQGAHLCASGPPLSQGSPLLRLLATLPLCCLLAAPPCLGLPPPQGPLSPSPFQAAGCSLPALPISCHLSWGPIFSLWGGQRTPEGLPFQQDSWRAVGSPGCGAGECVAPTSGRGPARPDAPSQLQSGCMWNACPWNR